MSGGKPLGEVVKRRMFRGILTGLNEAFIVNSSVREQLVRDDPRSVSLIKPMMRGEDLRPWYQADEGRWLTTLPNGWTVATFGVGLSEQEAFARLSVRHPHIASHLLPFADAARKRQDKGQYWWELRSCDYYAAFEQPKIFWPEIGKLPRCSWGEVGMYSNNKGYFIAPGDPFLLGVMQSRVSWFVISRLATPLSKGGTDTRYQQHTQFISRLPIPDAPSTEHEAIGGLAMQLTARARARYDLHARTRRRILTDFGMSGKGLNQKLTGWWNLDFFAFRAELQKVFKREIPVKERDDWEEWLAQCRTAHEQHTAEIIRLETELNARVYALFDLAPAEIAVIEDSTKYRYGEV